MKLWKKQQKLSETWALQRWINQFINENQDKWEKERKRKEDELSEEWRELNKYKRLEKIEKLKQK